MFGGYTVTNVNYLSGNLAPKELDDCWKCTLSLSGRKQRNHKRKRTKREVLKELRTALAKASKGIRKRHKHKRATISSVAAKKKRASEAEKEVYTFTAWRVCH